MFLNLACYNFLEKYLILDTREIIPNPFQAITEFFETFERECTFVKNKPLVYLPRADQSFSLPK